MRTMLVTTLLILGCGGDDNHGNNCSDKRSGEVNCVGYICTAGNYCEESSQKCFPGCTSDANCYGSDQCIRCGTESIGTCRPCGTSTSSVCGQAGACKRDANWDRLCQSPGIAYDCPSTGATSDLGKCVQSDQVPGTWCCGGGLANPCLRDTSGDGFCGGSRPKSYQCVPSDDLTSLGCALSPDGSPFWCCPN